MIIATRIIAVLICSWVGYSFITFPVFNLPLFFSFCLYLFVLWRFSFIWIIVLPALLPVFDLAPWSGRFLLTEFDLFILSTISVGLWFQRYSIQFFNRMNSIVKRGVIGLIIIQLVGLLIGLLSFESESSESFALYHSVFNSLRIAKGFWEALFLLPMLAYEKSINKPIARYFSTGMLIGLSLCVLSIFWERVMFPGLFDFRSNYRVSGMFSNMLLGGAYVDAYLVLAFPFIATCFFIYRSHFIHILGVFLFVGVVYSVLVTFSPLTYLAFIAVFVVLYIGRQLFYVRPIKPFLIKFTGLFGILLTIAFLIFSGRSSQLESAGAINKIQHYFSNWSKIVNLMGPGSFVWGMGDGTFPKINFDNSNSGLSSASFNLYKNDALSYLSFSASDEQAELFVRQRFSVPEAGDYEVRIKLRSWSDFREKLLVEFCERNIITVASRCRWLSFPVEKNNKGKWTVISKFINISEFLGFFSTFKPLEISLMNRGLKGQLDIAQVEIITPNKIQLIKNDHYANGFDNWFFSSSNHLLWQVNNFWISVFFEGGLIGVIIVIVLLGWVLFTCYQGVLQKQVFYLMIAASVIALMAVGLSTSLFNDPRINWLFFIILSFCILKPESIQVGKLDIRWFPLILSLLSVVVLVVIVGFAQVMNSFNLSARQVILEAEKRLPFEIPFVKKMVEANAKYTAFPFDGKVTKSHPRILFDFPKAGKERLLSFIQDRVEAHITDNSQFLSVCGKNDLFFETVCWLKTGNQNKLTKVVSKLLDFKLNRPTADTTYSNGWKVALVYDLIYPALNNTQRIMIEQKILQALNATLLNLDEESASLWHGRSTHAAIAWLCSVVLSDNRVEGLKQLQRRAQGHFMNAIDGLAFTEVWPGGYNYWIQSRGFLFALASSAYINGLNDAVQTTKVKNVMRQVGYWTLYATRPDDRIEGSGDEGSRVDLKDETRRVIDLIVQMTGDSVLAGYSKYLGKLHGAESYFRGYRWGFLLFNDPNVVSFGDGTFESLGMYLPSAKLFGRKTTNLAFFRSGWKKKDTFVSFKAGHTFSHHGHYDAGHFTIFKGKPLVINSSTYNGFFDTHRLNYAIRTVAKNSILVQNPTEVVKPNRFFKDNVADGGQRLTMPTGSAFLSVAHWYKNYRQGQHFEGAELIDYSINNKQYYYISSDLTSSYNSLEYDENGDNGKVSSIVRQLLYLPQEDHVIIFDKVISTQSDFQKKWLLHTINKPFIKGISVLKGIAENGIMQAYSDTAIIKNADSYLRVKTLLPENSIMHIVGGKDYRFYVETDSNDDILNGNNYKIGSSDKPWFDQGQWRLEIMPAKKMIKDDFLIVMSPSLGYPKSDNITTLKVKQKNAIGLMTEKSVVIFVSDYRGIKVDFSLFEVKSQIFIVGFPVSKLVTIRHNGNVIGKLSSNNGVLFFNSQEPLQGEISISW